MLIYLLGSDCCGKNSIMHALAKELNYEPFMSPRSPICNIVYDAIYDRHTDDRFLENVRLIRKFLELGAYFVLIHVKPEILLQRAIFRNEKHVSSLEVFKKHQKVYDYHFKYFKNIDEGRYSNRFLKVDNSGDLNMTIKKLKKKLKKYA